MLILSRRKQQNIVIRQPGCRPIVVTVSDILPGFVRLGFIAEQDCEINRMEIDQQKHGNDYPGGK